MTEPAPRQGHVSDVGNTDKKPSKWWLAVLAFVNFLFVETVFVVLGLTLYVPKSSVPGEATEVVLLDAIIFVPLAFVLSLLLLIPILRTLQLRNQVWAASVASWLPGVAVGVLFHYLGMYTNFFHLFMPIARLLE